MDEMFSASGILVEAGKYGASLSFSVLKVE